MQRPNDVPNDVKESRVHQRLSQLIRALIEDIGSERQLGRMTSLSGNALGLWTDLKADPRLLKLMQFAYHLGWSMSELMAFAEGDEDPKDAIARKKNSFFSSPTKIEIAQQEFTNIK